MAVKSEIQDALVCQPERPRSTDSPPPPSLDISEDGLHNKRAGQRFQRVRTEREGLTCEGLRAGVDACQALGRPKVRDLQDAAVGVDQHVVPLVDRGEKAV